MWGTLKEGHMLSELLLRNLNFIYQRTHIFSVGHACLGPKLNCSRNERAKRQMHAYLTILWCDAAIKQDCQTTAHPQATCTICFCMARKLSMVFTFPNDWKKSKDHFMTFENYMKIKCLRPLITFYQNGVMLFHSVLSRAAFLLQGKVATEALWLTNPKILTIRPFTEKVWQPLLQREAVRSKKREHRLGPQASLGWAPTSGTYCVTRGKLLNLSGLQFPHLGNADSDVTYLSRLLWGWGKTI